MTHSCPANLLLGLRRVFLLAVLAVVATVVPAAEPPRSAPAIPVAGGAPKPGPNDRAITLAVRNFLEREHYLNRPIDDEVARRWFKGFLEALDPMKVYFLQSDVDAFLQKRDSLDDLVKRGDVSFAYEVLARFLQRVDARLPLIERLLQTPQDFTKDESIIIDRDATTWARNEAEARTCGGGGSSTTSSSRRWRRHPKRRPRRSSCAATGASPSGCTR